MAVLCPLHATDLRSAPERVTAWGDEILYFVIVDRFADGDPNNNANVDIEGRGAFHGGDLKGLIKQLDYIADLGVTAVWITPVVKQIPKYVSSVGFPDWGYHGYWAEDFYQLDERFGTEDDLKKLVDEAHKRKIKILLDVVYNHAGYMSAYTKRPDANDWLRTGRRESLCGDDDITMCLSGLPDFKTEKPEVRDYLITYAVELAKRTGLDGFRLDTVKHIEHDFWQEHRERCNDVLGKDFFLLGEVWGGDHKVLDPYFRTDELDSGFDFGFKGSAQAFVQGRGRTIAFSRYLLKRHKIRDDYLVSHYLSSHDVPGALYELKNDKTLFKLCVGLKLTTLGLPMIYYGEEVGRFGGDWPENRTHMPWGKQSKQMPGAGKVQDADMLAFYKKLIQLRKAHPALSVGGMRELHVEGDLLAFARTKDGGEVWVAVNRAKGSVEAALDLPDTWKGKTVTEAMSGKPVKADGGKLNLKVPAQTIHIYTAE
ncbi:MAG: alpha-amylase family glycosyl hydrolase [Acidobacteriota bacterium]|nr:alpha-amylase family glycosyl hydrolase [Acidobacteriota bacterium]